MSTSTYSWEPASTRPSVASVAPLSRLVDTGGWLLLCLTAFVPLVNLDQSDEDIQLDLQVLIKIGILGASGLYCLWSFLQIPRLQRMIITFPVVAYLAVGGLLALAAVQSQIPKESLVSAGSAIVCMVLTLAVASRWGRWSALKAIVAGQGLFVIGSWIAYLAFPSIGVFLEPISGGEFFERMGGLAHPNTLGQLSAMVVLACFALFTQNRWTPAEWRWWARPLLVIAVAALVMSLSRTSMAACGLAAVIGLRHWLLAGSRKWLIAAGLFVGLLGFVILSSTTAGEDFLKRRLFDKLAKSGSAEELTSGTGRDVIWSYTAELISQKPILGYGCGTSKILLRDYSLYTHNMLLNVGLSGGVFAAGFLAMILLAAIARVFLRPHPVPDALLLFLVLNGLTENVIFENIASGATALLALTLAWHSLADTDS